MARDRRSGGDTTYSSSTSGSSTTSEESNFHHAQESQRIQDLPSYSHSAIPGAFVSNSSLPSYHDRRPDPMDIESADPSSRANNNSSNRNGNNDSFRRGASDRNDTGGNGGNYANECVSEEAAGKLLVVGSALCCVGILLILILVPLSFSYIEWDSVGFKRDKVKNIVYADKVYPTGRYFWGVGKTAFSFPKVYQHISFKNGEGDEFEGPLAIFTKSGVEVQLEISMQYRLIPDQLQQLYEKYGKVYHQQVVNIARAAIKNTAPNFTVDDYIRRRQNITGTFHEAVSRALEEVHVEVPPRKLQLRSMEFPPQIGERYLVAATEIQANQAKQFQQTASLVRKETDRLVSLVRANTTAVRLESSGNVGRIAREAEAEAERIVRTAEGNGIDLIFDTLGITTPERKREFLRLQAITSDSKVLLGVNSAIVNVPT